MTIVQFVSRVAVVLLIVLSPSMLLAQIPFTAMIDARIDLKADTMKAVGKAIKAWEADKYKEAIQAFDVAIKQYPKEAELYALRGLMKYYANQEQEAMKDMVKSFELSPQGVSHKNMLNYAFIATYAGNTAAALETFDALLQNPDSLEPGIMLAAFVGRGQIKAMMRNYEAALKDYQEYLQRRRSPEVDISALTLFAWANWFENRFAQTIDACNAVLAPSAISELREELFVNTTRGIRGASRFYQKDYVGCIEDLMAIAKTPDLVFVSMSGEQVVMLNNDERNLCLAHSYLFTNNYTKAEKIYKAELKKSPTFATALHTDLQKFKEYGTVHPDLAKVEALLPKK